MRALAAVLLLLLSSLPLRAETPWDMADILRAETGRIERLHYRPATAARDEDIATRLGRIETAWAGAADAFAAPDRSAISDALDAYREKLGQDDIPGAARWRQRLWARILAGARTQLDRAIAGGDAALAKNWLTIRDYARASGDTAAALAIQALGDGTLSPEAARATVEAELLTVAASELRLALARAARDAVKGYETQYAGDLGRIEGMVTYLEDSLIDKLGRDGLATLLRDLARAARDPDAISGIEALLAGYAPVTLPVQERVRRAALMRRFTALVQEEYGNGVKDGVVRIPVEYSEARMFRDRAAMILGDLAPEMDSEAAARLDTLLDTMRREIADKTDRVEPLVAEALALIDAEFGADVARGGTSVAFEQIAATLEELTLMASAGDWAGAETKRLEAYSWFDPDIEQRLVPRAPSTAMRLEARFWDGTASRPGLGALIGRRAEAGDIAAEVARVNAELEAARAVIEQPVSAYGVALQSALLLFREGFEAVLIIAALLAALRAEGKSPARFRGSIAGGVLLALGASVTLWAGARWLFSISTLAREALEGGTALLAALVLVALVMGFAAGGGHVARFRARMGGVANRFTVGGLAFLVVFREGFETVLFLEALLIDAAMSPVLAGLALGGAAALAAGWAVLASGRRLPIGVFFRVTTALLAILAVTLTGAGIRGLQTAALVDATPVGWFPDLQWLQVWFGVFPVAETLAAQAFVVILMLTGPAWRGFVRWATPTGRSRWSRS